MIQLQYFSGDSISVLLFADCPQGMVPHDKLDDKPRVLPGDGILPLVEPLQNVKAAAFHGPISLEVYNPELRDQEQKSFLNEALAKTVAVAARASR